MTDLNDGFRTSIGSREGNNDREWDGTLDEARISNTPRSPDWLQTSYNNQSSPSTFYAKGSEETSFIQGGSDGDRYMTKSFSAGAEGSVVLTGTDDAYWYAENPATINLTFDNSGWGMGSIWYSTSGTDSVGAVTIGVFKVSGDGTPTFMAALSFPSLGAGANHAQATGLALSGSGTTDFSAANGDRLAFGILFDDDQPGESLTIHFNHATYDTYVTSPNTDPGYPVPDVKAIIMFAAGLGFLGWIIWRLRKNRRERVTAEIPNKS